MSNATFVLDNSVAMRWLQGSTKKADQLYANSVLKVLAEPLVVAWVPNLWHLEASNVLLSYLHRSEFDRAEIESFVLQLEKLPVQTDTLTSQQALGHGFNIADQYRLSSYDAAYLELAMRRDIPIATLDEDLRKAAARAHVPLFEP